MNNSQRVIYFMNVTFFYLSVAWEWKIICLNLVVNKNDAQNNFCQQSLLCSSFTKDVLWAIDVQKLSCYTGHRNSWIYFSILWLDDHNLLIFDLLEEPSNTLKYSDSWAYENLVIFARISHSGRLFCQNIISLEGRWNNFINKYELSHFFLSSTYSET